MFGRSSVAHAAQRQRSIAAARSDLPPSSSPPSPSAPICLFLGAFPISPSPPVARFGPRCEAPRLFPYKEGRAGSFSRAQRGRGQRRAAVPPLECVPSPGFHAGIPAMRLKNSGCILCAPKHAADEDRGQDVALNNSVCFRQLPNVGAGKGAAQIGCPWASGAGKRGSLMSCGNEAR